MSSYINNYDIKYRMGKELYRDIQVAKNKDAASST